MEKFNTLIKLLGKPKSPKDYEVYHLIRDLKIQMSKLQDDNKRTSNDQQLTETLLIETMDELDLAKNRIKKMSGVRANGYQNKN